MTPADDLTLTKRRGLPDALRVLVEAYPREIWDGHDNFSHLIRFWLDRHLMFRRVMEQLQTDLSDVLTGEIEGRLHAQKLTRYGNLLVNELHMHHQIEDQHYFPRLIGLDARIDAGFELLEADHEAIDGLLSGFVEAANPVLGNPGDRDALGAFGTALARMAPLLDRHLTDEEEIIVPVLLAHAPEGLA